MESAMRRLKIQRSVDGRKNTRTKSGADESEEPQLEGLRNGPASEEKMITQPINLEALQRAHADTVAWSERDRRTTKKILNQAEERQLNVVYRRRRNCRWYSIGGA